MIRTQVVSDSDTGVTLARFEEDLIEVRVEHLEDNDFMAVRLTPEEIRHLAEELHRYADAVEADEEI